MTQDLNRELEELLAAELTEDERKQIIRKCSSVFRYNVSC